MTSHESWNQNSSTMQKRYSRTGYAVCWAVLLVAILNLSPAAFGRILDNFNDNTKTAWTDFTFVPGFGLPTEKGGQFIFDLPPAGQDIFVASQKVTENLELKEGRTLELRVDLVDGSGEDAFAVMAFIPNTGGNTPGTLGGYGLAKDPTDVLITKGVQKYFVADDGVTAELKQSNLTMVLTLTVRGGNVIITGKILDKEKNNAVIWERTVVDTPAADVMEDGTDTKPSEPYITTGYFTLYCYEQGGKNPPYSVTFDNAAIYVMDETVMDDFDDNKKTDWADFTFVPGFGLATETGGQFVFDLPPAGQDIFTAAQKTSRNIELTDGNRIELQVDLEDGSGEDAYAVLAFIPNTGGNTPGTLGGYGLAKDPTDVLITKGVQKYFVADDGVTAELKQNKVKLLLSLTADNGNVTITGKILDKEKNDAVLWERTVVDTPATDVMEDGTDTKPAEPYITTGYFTLYCYEQSGKAPPYRVVYDNAILRAPPAAANVAPLIQNVQPAEFSNFLPASTKVSFQVSDDKALSPEKISVTLNGTNYTAASGLTVTGSGNTLTATLGGLAENVNYDAVLQAEDADGVPVSRRLYFDTFLASNLTIEVEDYNFSGGQYIANPVPAAEGSISGSSYSLMAGVSGVDFSDSRTGPNGTETLYRPDDPVRMIHSRDFVRQKYTAAGGADQGVFDYDVGDITANEWLNYTRNFQTGTYEVYLREALANMTTGESVLEQVTSDRTQPDQTVKALGSFLGNFTGFQSRNFPLTDAAGKKVVLRLSGTMTLRLRQVTPDATDGARYLNYLLFLPVADPGKQRATVASVTPGPGETAETVQPVVESVIQNRDTSVDVPSIALILNGQKVNATVTATATGASVNYPMSPLPSSGATNIAQLLFKDSDGVSLTNEWKFVVSYRALDPAVRQSGPGLDRGFKVRVVQAPQGSNLANSLQRAEDQLAPGSSIPKFYETNVVTQVINFSQDGPGSANGAFPDDLLIPGLDVETNGNDDIALEALTYLELPAGSYRFGVISDDGYKVQCTPTFSPADPALSFVSGGTADQTFDLVVRESGFYPFRFVWYERGGGAHVEWFVVSLATGDRALINAGTGPLLIKAYTSVAAPAVQPKFDAVTVAGGEVTITWSGGGTLQESGDLKQAWTDVPGSPKSPYKVNVSSGGPLRFYRVKQ